jgi:signal transduction histidine kinase
VIVPILVDGEYLGAIGFDDCTAPRNFDSAIVSALEIAAGLIGAALHRERLLETMRLERERAAEARVAELAHANAAIRSNLEQLATQPDLRRFVEHMLLEITRQLDAAAGGIVVLDEAKDEWVLVAFAHEGEVISDPPVGRRASNANTGFSRMLTRQREPEYFELERFAEIGWPRSYEFHHEHGHQSFYALPLVFGERTIGVIGLAFRERRRLSSERSELLVALAQQITLAIVLKRLLMSAKNAAVLAERNRIGQEIHDGLAQAFTGILMQLGAAEEHLGRARGSPLPDILTRVRNLAREGLAEARRSVLALKPEDSHAGGLEVALAQLAERSTIAGRITCTFDGGLAGAGPAPEHQHELLRIAQEAVINAVRHAHPSTIRIVLLEEPSHWTLSVIDDGQGMEELPELYARQGFGLTNMRERAQAIGGGFAIQSRPGQGTRVIVSLPRP